MRNDVRRFLIEAAIGGLVLGAALFFRFFMPADGVLDVTGHPIGRDFLNVWAAPRIAAQQGVAALYDLQLYAAAVQETLGVHLQWFFGWSYPPSAVLLLKPFSVFPYPLALALWTIVGLAAFAGAVWSGATSETRRAAFIVAMLSPAALICVVSGQNGLLSGAALLVAMRCAKTRPLVAGVLLGLLTVKPHLGLLVPVALVAIGAWRTIAVAIATAAALFVASVIAYGVEPWRLWMTVTLAHQMSIVSGLMDNFNRYMLLSIFASLKIFGAPNALAWAAQTIGVIGGVAATWFAYRRSNDVAFQTLVLTLATLLATPYAFNYDCVAMTGALIMFLAGRDDLSIGERRAYGALFLLPIAVMALHMVLLPLGPIIVAVALLMVARSQSAHRPIAETPALA